MNALQVFEYRTNDRFLSIAPRFSAPSGPGSQATWQELDVHASVTPGVSPRRARRASLVRSLIRMSRGTAAAAAGLSLGWWLTMFVATLSGADGIRNQPSAQENRVGVCRNWMGPVQKNPGPPGPYQTSVARSVAARHRRYLATHPQRWAATNLKTPGH